MSTSSFQLLETHTKKKHKKKYPVKTDHWQVQIFFMESKKKKNHKTFKKVHSDPCECFIAVYREIAIKSVRETISWTTWNLHIFRWTGITYAHYITCAEYTQRLVIHGNDTCHNEFIHNHIINQRETIMRKRMISSCSHYFCLMKAPCCQSLSVSPVLVW